MFDVVIIGAGPSGLGMAVLLKKMGIHNFKILEQRTIGSSFNQWPKEMRFITPSFNGNDFGNIDLNSIAPETSPGEFLEEEHPSGKEYVDYLKACVEYFELSVSTHTKVKSVIKKNKSFNIETSKGSFKAKFIIWAGGEFWFPDTNTFEGASLCVHNTRIKSWQELNGNSFIILGGYESGIDAAFHLINNGKKVIVIDKYPPWEEASSDPSRALSTYTKKRLTEAYKTKRLTLIGNTEIKNVTREKTGQYIITANDGQKWKSATQPILATGFSLHRNKLVNSLFERNNNGHFALSENDESLSMPGAFLIGPSLRHQDLIFCFIYKFRGRLPIVAKTIAENLKKESSIPSEYSRSGFLVDDLSCCGDSCAC